ncbi:MAG: dihydropteroate synthase [Deltaproteobacteria bacterium]|nr:dihydropteroate synthase [Deltaproteobacteria bacterium]MBW2447109.1 dihydropteroate synthase [Deltaproteobacteria bacterium]
MNDERQFREGRVTLVGILNLTPDSFSDGGRFVSSEGLLDGAAAVDAGCALVRDGADVLDVGGESTRPGAAAVSVGEEIRRTAPALEALAKACDAPLSIDTRRFEVAEAALEAGATILNDVSGLRHDPRLAELAARAEATLIVGHLRGEPATMQRAPRFEDVVSEVAAELADSVAIARAAGVPDERIVVDPGIGFGKTLEHNLALLTRLGEIREALGLPILVGTSRKSFLGRLGGAEVPGDRGAATQAADAIAVYQGADALRVHDVAAAAQTARVASALRAARDAGEGGS